MNILARVVTQIEIAMVILVCALWYAWDNRNTPKAA
jgi:hypothetical protein